MFGSKISIRKELMQRVKLASEKFGCASVEEFVESVLEKEMSKMELESNETKVTQKEIEDITSKLKGLGYID